MLIHTYIIMQASRQESFLSSPQQIAFHSVWGATVAPGEKNAYSALAS